MPTKSKNKQGPRRIQIFKYQTVKQLVECVSKLKAGYPPSPTDNQILLHHKWSKIGINVLDYTNGAGNNSVFVSHNLDPEVITYLFERIKTQLFLSASGKKQIADTYGAVFLYTDQKTIADQKNSDGTCLVTKFTLKCVPTSKSGEKMRYPWIVSCETGSGIPVTNALGGTSIKKDSYKSDKSISVMMGDKDIYCLLEQSVNFIHIWETTLGANLIRQYEKGEIQ